MDAIVRTRNLENVDTDIPSNHAFVSSPVVIRSRIPMDILLRAYVGELIRSVVKQMTLRKEKGTPIILWNEIINVLANVEPVIGTTI